MNPRICLIAMAAAAFVGTAARADIHTFGGDTSGAPIFNRLVEDLSALSTTGTAVPYSAFMFTVDASGPYTFLSTAAFDNFTFLYSGAFDASQPMVGALAGNDDLISATTSGFAYELSTGTTYTLVTTGFDNADFGVFSNTIGGEGVISVVPEPAVWMSMALGLVGVVAAARRRRSPR